MEPSSELLVLLDQFPQPVFLVQKNMITHLNHAAQVRQLAVGTPVTKLITIGESEYKQFSDGRLFLTVTIDQIVYNASVVRLDGYDLFILESEYQSPELRALALAAQNLREPLSGAMLSVNGLLNEANAQESGALCEEIYKLNKHLYQLHRLIGNMSDAARYHQRLSLQMEVRDVVGFIAEIVEKVAALTGNSKHGFELQLLKAPLPCLIDAEKLERALLNLISNAIKYSPEGGVIRIVMHQGLNKLYLSVENPKGNSDKDMVKDLFFRFLREPSLENDGSGIGLGLSIVHGAAVAHNGTVLIENPAGEGLKFTMSLSLEQAKTKLRSPAQLSVDSSGGFDRTLIELADILPPEAFK